MQKLNDLDQFDRATVVKHKTGALLTGFITTPNENPLGAAQADDGAWTASLEPGTIQRVSPGESLEFPDPPETGVAKTQLRLIASGLGLPNNVLSGDLSDTSCSSARGGLNRTVSVVFASNAPCPILNSHNRSDVNAVLGFVESAQVDGERGTATIRFSERATAVMNGVRQGILRSVSVGYLINQRRAEKDPTTGVRTVTATRWTPKEISFVAIPADSAARVRGEMMEQTNENEIRNLTLDQACAEAFEAMKRRSGPPIRTAPPISLAAGYDDPAFLRTAMADAIYTRMNPAHKPGDAARPFVGRSMVRLAEEVLRLRGIWRAAARRSRSWNRH